ncbi:ATP-dependent helicase HrpB [Pleomorphomonas sp. JP5]|uniref:ATP-dependent helicase HrpB n=1 Tax=Pleomorphomonas sp. JP5 TaxID=2942998 RepID=UPI0020437BBA|nr:ATP-dependent helicase HrpB [Pleomorphomonas sp. JP5]MCM5558020.1 ATP-dependent helicase HrpB [Pleomorphomonas sp. JP5]
MISIPDRFSPPLPIDAVLDNVRASLETSPRLVLVAAPGAGKTTRVPLALLGAPWRRGKLLVVEPRRIAARAAAARMAENLGENVGQTVGYRVRMDSKISANTVIEVITEGVFTRMVVEDPILESVSAVLFDEFHERSLDGDLGLALALDGAALRDDLRIVVMSATLDGGRVASLLGGAPVVESAGRTFPVETRHIDRDPLLRFEDQVAEATLRAIREEDGSALVFLPGQAEIRRVAERLEGRLPLGVRLAPLYGALTAAEQDFAIRPCRPPDRKVVLATAIAETSLTIDGVRLVIDGGLSRVPRYEPDTGLTRLETVRVSRASADQRLGRAGRTEPGVCWRLWNEGQTAALPPYSTPEILEADLSQLALDLAAVGIRDPATLAFLDPPPRPAWNEAQELLRGLEAIDDDGRITAEGKALARLPLPPRLAHMIHRAAELGAGRMAADIAAILTEQGLGGDATDLADRLQRFKADRGRRATDARAMAARWAKLVGGDEVAQKISLSPGGILSFAYPDRVAEARGQRGTFRLASGRGGMLEDYDRLAKEDFLVVADLAGKAERARIRLAAAISRDEIETLFASRIVAETALQFDATARAVRARRIRRLGAVKLAEEPMAAPADVETVTALLSGVRRVGVDRLGWSKDQRRLRERSSFLNRTVGEPWPDLSDGALAEELDDWLAPFVDGLTRFDDIDAALLGAALDRLVPYGLRQDMDRLMPSHFEAPTGSRVPIDYAADGGPAVEIRVQELFGLDRHPAIAGGRVPLTLVLTSPAHRPIQTTKDLPGFWRGSWKDVAKDLKGRYPKHPWPEDPLAAEPTRRAKPRGA